MGAYIKNELLEQIQKVYPQDTVDDILDWAEASEQFDQSLTVSEYTKWRNPIHRDQNEIGCV